MCRRIVPVVLLLLPLFLLLVLTLAGPPAMGQESTTTVPAPVPSSPDVGPVGDLGAEGGSPVVLVALSFLGGATALAIMAVQWVRTRPPGHRSD
jgi:hypothetical protein